MRFWKGVNEGQIIFTSTVDDNGDINTVTLIGVDADILDEAEVSDAVEEDAEETGSDTGA